MSRILLQSDVKPFLSPTAEESYFFSQPPPPPLNNNQPDNFNFNSKVSPSILLIIVILAIIFFVSGLLHLLVRFLLRPPNRDTDDLESVSALQGQLQQLFHLHDAGVDQSFIDTLPVFNYKAIIGLKNPFDCAVCLCEFEPDDKLRLLPKCSHAFHMECIDTWLLSHSTCPLCRASLLQDFSSNTNCSTPIVLVLESGSESSREIITDRDVSRDNHSSLSVRQNAPMSFREEEEEDIDYSSAKSTEIPPKNEDNPIDSTEKVVTVKLGKFRNVDGVVAGEGSSTTNTIAGDARRCFSMGSFAYVMDENSSLQVPIRTPLKKQSSKNKKPNLPLKPGHRAAISECDCDSRREFEFTTGVVVEESSRNIVESKRRESFSISKIWLRSGNRAVVVVSDEDLKSKNNAFPRRTVSEIDVGRWENGRSELGSDQDENQSCNSLDSSQSNHPSFARKTLLWLMGRQNKER
uniref:RING-type E3 ubiquitin transferase n=1 Tax=Cannabis sativa TaxID=3483 RepID=A0A803QAQ2_CANSA